MRRIASVFLLLSFLGCNRAGGPGGGPHSSGKTPTFDYEAASGCGRFHVYRTNKGSTEVFAVSGDLDELGLKEGVKEYDLEAAPKSVTVTVELYPKPQKHLHHCQDFTDPSSDKPEVWTATRGHVKIERFTPGKKDDRNPMPLFRVKVTVTDGEFRSPDGRTARCPHPVELDTQVGWFAG
jgi:hypothetical protein